MPPSKRKPAARPSSRVSTTRKKKKKSTASTRSFLIVVAILAVFAMVFRYVYNDGQTPFEAPPPNTVDLPTGEEIRVYYLDVGQGDSILIQTSEHNVLIDSGEFSSREALLSYLRDAGVATIDYLVATHPHADHIGGMVPVLNNFTVKEAVMPDVISDTTAFETFVELLDEQKIPTMFPKVGDVITAGIIALEVVGPITEDEKDLNNSSLVLRMQYGDTAFLFTGDAEKQSENEMMDASVNLRANILKAGHHGSSTATSEEFLDAVKPHAVVISVGKHNSYDHPHDEMLEIVEARDIPIYRTDRSGTIILTTDGTQVKLISSVQNE